MRYWIYGDREDEAKVLDVKTNQADLTGLYPFCDYETRVCAYNAMGDGHFSNMVPCQTLEDGGSSSRRPHLTSFILHPLLSSSPPHLSSSPVFLTSSPLLSSSLVLLSSPPHLLSCPPHLLT